MQVSKRMDVIMDTSMELVSATEDEAVEAFAELDQILADLGFHYHDPMDIDVIRNMFAEARLQRTATPRARTSLSADERKGIVLAHREGRGIKEIAEQFNVYKSVVRDLVLRAGVDPIHATGKTNTGAVSAPNVHCTVEHEIAIGKIDATEEEAVEGYEELSQIVAQLGFQHSGFDIESIRKLFEGVEAEPDNRPRPRTSLTETEREQIAQAHRAGNRIEEIAAKFRIWKAVARQVVLSEETDAVPSKPQTNGRGRRRLSDDQVRDLRKRHAGGESLASLVTVYGLKKQALKRVVQGSTYADVS